MELFIYSMNYFTFFVITMLDIYWRRYTYDIQEAKKHRLRDPTPINFLKWSAKKRAETHGLWVNLYTKHKDWETVYYLPNWVWKKRHKRNIQWDLWGVSFYDFQQKAINETVSLYEKWQRKAIIHADTWSGKTFITMGILAKLWIKAVIVPSKKILVKQLYNDYKDKADVWVQVGWGEIKNNQILIMTPTTFNMIYEKINGKYGVLAIDEAHNLPSKRIDQVNMRRGDFIFWLTATPVRSDMNLQGFVTFFENYILVEQTKKLKEKVLPAVVYQLEYRRDYTLNEVMKAQQWLWPDAPNFTQNLIENDHQKDDYVVDVCKMFANKWMGDIIVFTDRIEHCIRLTEKLSGVFDHVYEFRWETDKDYVVDQYNKTWWIIVWLKACCKEWFNIPKLQVGVLAMSSSWEWGVVQMIWRTRRQYGDKKYWFFVDIYDNIAIVWKKKRKKPWYYSRKKIYSKYNFITKPLQLWQ